MTPDEYEHLVASVLRREGWDATGTPSVRDMGLDVVAERGGVRLGVQVRMYRAANRPVNAEVVMLTYGACAYADCTACMIVTDGRVLKDAERVAAKLDVEIRIIPAAAAANDDAAGPREGAGDRQSFGRIWSEDLTPLAGRTLHRANGRSNHILAVDTAGVVRRTSNGRTQRIDIEVFRWAIDRLLNGEAVLREDINAHCVGRASSGVMLILSELPMFEPMTQGRKQGLRLHARLLAGLYLADANRGRCCALRRSDLLGSSPQERDAAHTPSEPLRDAGGASYAISAVHCSKPYRELRWTRRASGDTHEHPICLRDLIAALQAYEPARSLTASAIAHHENDPSVSVCRLRAELQRVDSSRIVLNKRLREAVLQCVERGESLSEIASRCGRIKRHRDGNISGETSWLSRRIGALPEGGQAEPTQWVHSDVLALIARQGLDLCPAEVEAA